MVTPRVYVEAPPVTPLPFGLFSAAMVVDDATPRWLIGGIQSEPQGACIDAHETVGACLTDLFGSVSISVDATGEATLTVTDQPELVAPDVYTVNWGDGTIVTAGPDTDGLTHTYAAADDYTVTISSPFGYQVAVVVTVVDADASGPFTADAEFSKIITDGIPVVEGDPFTVYQLFRCRPVGGVDGRERARDSLRLSEARAVEAHLARQLAADGDVVDLTPAGDITVVEGLALLEAYAARNYGGVPVIHAPRGAGTLLTVNGVVQRGNGRLETVQGSYVASGAGYEDYWVGDGSVDLYVTGAVMVRRAAAIEVGPVMTQTPPTNEFLALAERPYVLSWECVTAKVTVVYPNAAA